MRKMLAALGLLAVLGRTFQRDVNRSNAAQSRSNS